MVCNLPELSLDLSLPVIESPVPEFLTGIPINGVGDSEDLPKLKEFIHGLEDELQKIHAFKRELPLSFILLNDAIRKLKEKEKKQEEGWNVCKPNENIKVRFGNDVGDRKDWMSSAQLWSPSEGEEENRKCERGAFSSFGKCGDGVPKLSLAPMAVEQEQRRVRTGGVSPGPNALKPVEQTVKPQVKPYQTARKQRRCWSPELHRRFLDALQQLGGSQVATPKQIRELMQVEGLTNDEVKSHLQKYRLHVRKLPGGSTKSPSSPCEVMDGDKLELGYSSMDVLQSGSTEGPLNLEASRKCHSSSVEDDEEEKSDGHSWKVQRHVVVT